MVSFRIWVPEAISEMRSKKKHGGFHDSMTCAATFQPQPAHPSVLGVSLGRFGTATAQFLRLVARHRAAIIPVHLRPQCHFVATQRACAASLREQRGEGPRQSGTRSSPWLAATCVPVADTWDYHCRRNIPGTLSVRINRQDRRSGHPGCCACPATATARRPVPPHACSRRRRVTQNTKATWEFAEGTFLARACESPSVRSTMQRAANHGRRNPTPRQRALKSQSRPRGFSDGVHLHCGAARTRRHFPGAPHSGRLGAAGPPPALHSTAPARCARSLAGGPSTSLNPSASLPVFQAASRVGRSWHRDLDAV